MYQEIKDWWNNNSSDNADQYRITMESFDAVYKIFEIIRNSRDGITSDGFEYSDRIKEARR